MAPAMKPTRETKQAHPGSVSAAAAAPISATAARRTEEILWLLARCEDELIFAAKRGQLVEGAMHRIPLGVIMCAAATLDLVFVNQTAHDYLAHHPNMQTIPGGHVEGQSLSILDGIINLDRALLGDPRFLPLSRDISVNGERRPLAIVALEDSRGAYFGPMLIWPVATAALGDGPRL